MWVRPTRRLPMRSSARSGSAKLAVFSLLLGLSLEAAGPVLVITPGGREYLFGAGGTLARMIDEGRAVYVLQFGNDEKDSAGLDPAATRLANNAEAQRAARLLGVRELVNLGHKSGELGYICSSELRNQVMAMTRLYKPEVLFFPDWYIHYVDNWDIYRIGRMAEESPYGGGSYFLQELTYIGFPGFAAREYYFYSSQRPYRPREGGEGRARLRGVDIGPVFERKLKAILELGTANHRYAGETQRRLAASGRPSGLLRELSPESIASLVRAYLEELGETIGARHGHQVGEEFNHLGQTEGLGEHIRERARAASQGKPGGPASR